MADITHINKNAWGPQQVLGIQRGPETQKSWRTAEVDYFPPGILILFNQQYYVYFMPGSVLGVGRTGGERQALILGNLHSSWCVHVSSSL